MKFRKNMPYVVILTVLSCLSAVHAGNICCGSANGNEREFTQKKAAPERRYEDVPFTDGMAHYIDTSITSMSLRNNSKNSALSILSE